MVIDWGHEVLLWREVWYIFVHCLFWGFCFRRIQFWCFGTQSIVCPSVKNQSDTVASPQRPTIQLKHLCVFVFWVDNTALVTRTFSHFKSLSIRNFSWHTVKLDLALKSSLHQPDILTTCLPLIRFTYIWPQIISIEFWLIIGFFNG